MHRLSLIALLLAGACQPAYAGYPVCYPQRVFAAPVYSPGVYVPPISDPNWRTGVVNALYAKAKLESDSADYAAALQALNGTYAGPVASQGNTVYGELQRGYALGAPLQAYSQTNLEVLWNQANRHTENAQTLGGQAQKGFLAAVQETQAGQERVAAIMAKVELLKASEPNEVRKTVTQSQVSTGPAVAPQPAAMNLGGLLQVKCVSCHSPTMPSGGVDLTKYASFSQEAKARVKLAILNPDPEKRMPKRKEGDAFAPGESLAFDEIMLFRD